MTTLATIDRLIALAEKAHQEPLVVVRDDDDASIRPASHAGPGIWTHLATVENAYVNYDDAGESFEDPEEWGKKQEAFATYIAASSPAALLPVLRMAREAVAGWRPIDTAPKCLAVPMEDPTRGYTVKPVYVLGFIPDDAPKHDREQGLNVVWWEPLAGPGKKGCWCRDGQENILPTHWMPLPPAPTTEEG
jgi:hypothetical protein